MAKGVLNEAAERSGWAEALSREPITLHRRLPGYAPTPLHHWRVDEREKLGDLSVVCRSLGVKDESNRLTLPSFKILGSSWAVYRELLQRLGEERIEPWYDVGELRARIHACPLGPLRLVTASDGNHGRAVACVARWLGLAATVFVPDVTVAARVEAIRAEGAQVEAVHASYDETVRRAAAFAAASEHTLLVQDTSWDGYEDIPARVIEGYSTLLWEIEDQLAAQEAPTPDLVVVPVGVGSLAAAVVRHFRRPGLASYPRLLGVEAAGSECAFASLQAGERTTVPEGPPTIMAGLNCGSLATLAWPLLRRGIDAVVVLEDAWAAHAVRRLNRLGVVSGESGAAGVAALLALAQAPALESIRLALDVGPQSHVLTFSTEGVTDPVVHADVLSREP